MKIVLVVTVEKKSTVRSPVFVQIVMLPRMSAVDWVPAIKGGRYDDRSIQPRPHPELNQKTSSGTILTSQAIPAGRNESKAGTARVAEDPTVS
jgi:hypothetical protein